jgi:hypothetical protein
VGTVEQAPAIEGRAMSMMIVPAKGIKKKTAEDADGKPVQPEKIEQPQG